MTTKTNTSLQARVYNEYLKDLDKETISLYYSKVVEMLDKKIQNEECENKILEYKKLKNICFDTQNQMLIDFPIIKE